MFLVASATSLATVLSACGTSSEEVSEADVPVGSATVVGNFIIAQPTPKQYVAYSATCPHAGSKVSIVEGNTVRCPAHNSVFNIADGSVVEGPASSPLSQVQLTHSGGTLTISQ